MPDFAGEFCRRLHQFMQFCQHRGRLSLFSRDAEYSLNAELKASASGALKKTRYRGGTSEVSLRMA